MEGYGVFLEALKWTALVFLAGFVGYFGKYIGIKIISRFHKDEAPPPGGTQGVALGGRSGEKASASGQSGVQTSELPAAEPANLLPGDARQADDKLSKKQDKEHVKQAKKLNKAKSKQQKKQP